MKSPTMLAVLVCCAAEMADAQTITGVLPQAATRSGRLVITGNGFGDDQGVGRVLVGGIEAPVSYWSDEKVRAYVPEAAPVGPNDVVVVAGGPSNAVPVGVAARPPRDGCVLWRFEADDRYIRSQPVIGPDGTIYFTAIHGHLYALSPDGGLKWIFNGAGGIAAPDVGPDGTIYVGGSPVKAINPDGTLKWLSETVPGTIYIGPNVGPDGNIYGATGRSDDYVGYAFVLSPDGNVISRFEGTNFRHAPASWEVAFGPDAAYLTSGMGFPLEGFIGLLSFGLGGGFNWVREGIGQPFTDAAGNVYIGNAGGEGIASYDPDGGRRWLVDFGRLGGQPGTPTLGSDGTFYMPVQFGMVSAINPDGSIRWGVFPYGTTEWPQARPDNEVLIVRGFTGFSEPRLVSALDTDDGSVLWEIPLPRDGQVWINPAWYPEFSLDGATVYVPTSGDNTAAEPHCYLYAIDAGPINACAADFNEDGTLDLSDFVAFRDAFLAGNPSADINGDGALDLADFLAYRSGYVGGCP